METLSSKPQLRVLLDHFAAVTDSRQSWKVAYPLREVLFLVVCGTNLVRNNKASDLVRRSPFCEPIPPLTDTEKPQIRAAGHLNPVRRVSQLANVLSARLFAVRFALRARKAAFLFRPTLIASAQCPVARCRRCVRCFERR
jgi:hypothetical protein